MTKKNIIKELERVGEELIAKLKDPFQLEVWTLVGRYHAEIETVEGGGGLTWKDIIDRAKTKPESEFRVLATTYIQMDLDTYSMVDSDTALTLPEGLDRATLLDFHRKSVNNAIEGRIKALDLITGIFRLIPGF